MVMREFDCGWRRDGGLATGRWLARDNGGMVGRRKAVICGRGEYRWLWHDEVEGDFGLWMKMSGFAADVW